MYAGLDECAFCATPTWCEYRKDGRPQCKACKVERFFQNILFGPIGFLLLLWQTKVLRGIYGNVDEYGRRIARQAYVSVAKKNGKSFLVGGLPIYHLIAEEEHRPEAYGAAAAKDQGGIVFRAAAHLVRSNPALLARLKVNDSTKRIVRKDGGGFYAVLSADGDVQDGIEPSLTIMDELHRWKTQRADTLYDVLTRGSISRREPLTVQITTAGEVYDSPICYREYELAKQALSAGVGGGKFYAAIWEANADQLEKEPDYWKSREARVAANPSHEDLGGFLKDEAIVEHLLKAELQPDQRDDYLRYHLNAWVAAERRAVEMDKWDRGAVELRPLVKRKCWAAVDLSSKIDLTSLVFVFPDDDGGFDLLPFFWMAEGQVAKRERLDRKEYRQWARDGLLKLTPGTAVDYSEVAKTLEWGRETFDLQTVAYDPWNATQFVEGKDGLDARGFKCVEIRQGFQSMSEPTKTFLELIVAGKIRHAGHKILRWNVDCLSTKSDGNGNVRPAKPDREKSGKRIDGAVAAIMAIGRAVVERSEESVYNTRGVLEIG